MLAELRNFNVNQTALDELFALSALGKMVRAEYVNRNLPAPEWLTEQLETLDREILSRRRDDLEKQYAQNKAQLAALETPAEKRERLKKDQAELAKMLGRENEPTPV